MLDANALAQLQSLKSDIQSSQPRLSGRVKGTGRSFGFVVGDDGLEYFLPPEGMARVFPGDKVTFLVEQQGDGKVRASLEALEESALDVFVGRYVERGKAQGVEPEDAGHAKWLFVPPKKTADAQSGQWVKARVTRHPWETGKAQAEIEGILGAENEAGTWHRLAIEKYQLVSEFSAEELAAADALDANLIEQLADTRSDLTDLPFVTIDGATTRDMDDALFAEEIDTGWLLHVAIADPSAWFETNSALDNAARKRLTTTYLPGQPLDMLPKRLAEDLCSLVPDAVRLALVFHLHVDRDGTLSKLAITPARIRSTAKLSYTDVSRWLDGEEPIPAQHWHLETLRACSNALNTWRQNEALVMADRPDYRIRVDEQLAVTCVDREDRTTAHALVEESMLATNRIAAAWLADDRALFMTHPGFRGEREEELKGLLRECAPSVADEDGNQLDGYRRILRAARDCTDFPLQKVLQKRLERGLWTAQAAPHFGLGFEQYTTVTSPIRKYSDLTVHRLIKAKLNDEAFAIDNALVDTLNDRLGASRKAANEVDNHLRLQWLAQLSEQQPEQTWAATIVHINAGGLIVQLDDNGASGFVDLRSGEEKFSYDALRMLMKSETRQFVLDQALTVRIQANDGQKLELALVE
ncbi:VacB/RNase II family 3'-5' exoribonuclease [Saccharospirillum mangrovi]|uniref:VacB/RNase II family 3'-5' exoribonuclease n=1 Tax=Saccharospirillum mangrovi TaxID=2161747 RepID=UPI000D36A21B|nr:VacB/RNase II family 3'-5' exoribonuclease [Saccharospirillum mangrovi]